MYLKRLWPPGGIKGPYSRIVRWGQPGTDNGDSGVEGQLWWAGGEGEWLDPLCCQWPAALSGLPVAQSLSQLMGIYWLPGGCYSVQPDALQGPPKNLSACFPQSRLPIMGTTRHHVTPDNMKQVTVQAKHPQQAW